MEVFKRASALIVVSCASVVAKQSHAIYINKLPTRFI
jgi:hypothetical protein